MSIFSENLKCLRKQKKISQVILAKELEISPSAITMYEQGRREPNFELLKRIAVFFQVDYNILLGEKIVPDEPEVEELFYTRNQKNDVNVVSNNVSDYVVCGAITEAGADYYDSEISKDMIPGYHVDQDEFELVEFLRNNPMSKELLALLKKIDADELEKLLGFANNILK
ncbi:helix-turn-helix transcriptional regulator [Acetobacterium wieringae]|uniref:helix-turn-helix domain-containing protein n=1 Tax=Acetobacterium wieringae TaxID=52694 RepID=UPI0031582DE8